MSKRKAKKSAIDSNDQPQLTYTLTAALQKKCVDAGMSTDLNGPQSQDWLCRYFEQIFTGIETESFKPVKVPWFRRCPSCFKGLGGKGRATGTKKVSGTLSRRYMKCDQCGHNFHADVRIEVLRMETKIAEL